MSPVTWKYDVRSHYL